MTHGIITRKNIRKKIKLSNLTYKMSFTSLSYDNNTVLVNAVRIGFRTSTVDSHYFFFFWIGFSNFITRNEKGYINEEIGGEIVSFFFSIGFEGEIEKLIDRVSG